MMTQSVDDFLSQWFENSYIRASQGYYCSVGTFAGPKTPGTAYVLIHHLLGEHDGAGGWGFMRGGNGTISHSVAQSAARWGMKIETNVKIDAILVENGAAVGVATTDGREYRGKSVISNANSKTLFLNLLDRQHTPQSLIDEINAFRTFSTAFKINVAAERPPQYSAFNAERAGFAAPSYVHIGPDIDYLEKAYDDAKYGRYSSKPFISPMVPTVVDDTMAPPGKHLIHMFGGHAPYELRNSNCEKERDGFVDTVFATIDDLAPGFSDGVIDKQVLLPPDMEEILGLPQGHIYHGEISPDQLFFQRPAPHYADYRTPIRHLYQCGSSTHPGGGVSGIPGYNAAREILRDFKRGQLKIAG